MPIGQFQIFYESDDEELSVGKAINLEMYFLAIGFPEWEGFSVFQDPVYAAYSAVKGADTTSFAPTITESPGISTIEVDAGTTVELSWVAMDEDPYLCELLDENDNVISSSSWLNGYPVTVSIHVVSGVHNYRMVFYDHGGHAVQSDVVTITGTIPTTTTPTSTPTTTPTTTPTVTPTITPTTSPSTIPKTTSISRTSDQSDGGIPGFTLEVVLTSIAIVLPVIVIKIRKRK
jgi:hypothetical protein